VNYNILDITILKKRIDSVLKLKNAKFERIEILTAHPTKFFLFDISFDPIVL